MLATVNTTPDIHAALRHITAAIGSRDWHAVDDALDNLTNAIYWLASEQDQREMEAERWAEYERARR